MILPEPALTLTIPSIHDGTVLDCRVYHPASLAANPRAPPWRRHAAIFAHPYAPMGGSYDDPVLEIVAAQLLRKGYLVGTFNFRGAGHSAGRTSWTAKPERDDYASFIGFLVYYIHHLDPFKHHAEPHQIEAESEPELEHGREPDPSLTPKRAIQRPHTSLASELLSPHPTLIIGGYSYGAMITTKLPPLDKILEPFASPAIDSDAAHIRLRAEHLATQENLVLGSARSAMRQRRNPSSPTKRGHVRIGGDEGPGSPRRSHESPGRRSFSLDGDDKFRKGVNDFIAKRKSSHHKHRLHFHRPGSSRSLSNLDSPQSPAPADADVDGSGKEKGKEKQDDEKKDEGDEVESLPVVADLLHPQPAYLLVSPLQGMVTHLATMSLIPSALSSKTKHPHEDATEQKLVHNPTLAIYGDKDVFVAVSKLRAWAERLGSQEGSQFRNQEVATAGHFWAEEGVLYRMRDLVGEFAGKLLDG